MSTAKYALPELVLSQASKEITHNEALNIIDILMAKAVNSIVTAPPGSPANGDTVLVKATATGAFTGHETEIAYWLDAAAAWQFIIPTDRMEITDLSNNWVYRFNAGSGAWDQYSGTYTPTLTAVTNISGSTPYLTQFSRVGNVVTVAGKLKMNATGTGAAELGISLPVPSNFANDYECGGTGASDLVADGPLFIEADVTNNRAALKSTQNGTTNHDHFFHFTYLVV